MSHIYLNENLLFLRENLTGLRQKEFAQTIGIKVTTYGNYETGHSKPSYLDLKMLADHYNLLVDDLLFKNFKNEKEINAKKAVQLEQPENITDNASLRKLLSDNQLMKLQLDDISERLLLLSLSVDKIQVNVGALSKDNIVGEKQRQSPKKTRKQ